MSEAPPQAFEAFEDYWRHRYRLDIHELSDALMLGLAMVDVNWDTSQADRAGQRREQQIMVRCMWFTARVGALRIIGRPTTAKDRDPLGYGALGRWEAQRSGAAMPIDYDDQTVREILDPHAEHIRAIPRETIDRAIEGRRGQCSRVDPHGGHLVIIDDNPQFYCPGRSSLRPIA